MERRALWRGRIWNTGIGRGSQRIESDQRLHQGIKGWDTALSRYCGREGEGVVFTMTLIA